MFDHENKHYSDYKKYGYFQYNEVLSSGLKESCALHTQMSAPSWKGTSPNFKKSIKQMFNSITDDELFRNPK